MIGGVAWLGLTGDVVCVFSVLSGLVLCECLRVYLVLVVICCEGRILCWMLFIVVL